MSLESKKEKSAPRAMPQTEKTCKFPDCTTIFTGVGAAKYCHEHRKPEYRKIINEIKRKEKVVKTNYPEHSNEIIEHSLTKSEVAHKTCACGENFDIIIIPGVDIYPKYCELHRNPFKRDQMLKRLGLYVQPEVKTNEENDNV